MTLVFRLFDRRSKISTLIINRFQIMSVLTQPVSLYQTAATVCFHWNRVEISVTSSTNKK